MITASAILICWSNHFKSHIPVSFIVNIKFLPQMFFKYLALLNSYYIERNWSWILIPVMIIIMAQKHKKKYL